MRKLILMMLLAVFSNSAMAEWVKVGKTELGTYYADPTTVGFEGKWVTMWSLLDLEGKGSIKTKSEYDCLNAQARTLAIYMYSGKLGGGVPTRMIVKTGQWEPASPESAAYAKLVFVCDTPNVGWYDSPPATSSATTTPRGLPPDVEALIACPPATSSVTTSPSAPYGPVLAELTVEQRIARALVSPKAQCVETLLKFIPEGTPKRENVVTHLNELNKQLAINAKKMEAEEKKDEANKKANMVLLRREYGNKLRDKFLDDGMDIKVSTSGTSSNRLYFKYALFNDVWVHKFQKGSLIDEIKEMGFKKVDFDNGYDYHVYFTFK